MKLFASVLMVLFAATLLSGCGDGPCDAGFSFKYCLNQSSSSSSAPTYTIGGTVTGLGAAQAVTLVLNRPAVSFSAPSADPTSFPGSGTVGWSFTLDASKNISYLGLYNTDLNADTTVAIWNSSGQEVVKRVFVIQDLLIKDSPIILDSGFFWLPITQVLAPGQYTIGAISTANHFGAYGSTPVASYGLKLNTMSMYGTDAVLSKSSLTMSDIYPNGFFGPNFRFSTQKVISANGAFTFDASLLNSEMYTVTVSSQPSGATCKFIIDSVTNEKSDSISGKINGANLTNLTISCTQNSAG